MWLIVLPKQQLRRILAPGKWMLYLRLMSLELSHQGSGLSALLDKWTLW